MIYIQRRIAILSSLAMYASRREERDPVNSLRRKMISRHEINSINIGNEPVKLMHEKFISWIETRRNSSDGRVPHQLLRDMCNIFSDDERQDEIAQMEECQITYFRRQCTAHRPNYSYWFELM